MPNITQTQLQLPCNLTQIAIIGVGGIGSWTAEFLQKQFLNRELPITYIDYDIIEHKNIERQNYVTDNINAYKAVHLGLLHGLIYNNETTKYQNTKITTLNLPILPNRDLTLYIITTDNITSKQIIAQHAKHYIIAHCQKDKLEVRNYLNESDQKAWDIGGGYNNEQQTIETNVIAAALIIRLIRKWAELPTITQQTAEIEFTTDLTDQMS